MIGKKEKELSEIKTMKEEYLLLREKMKEVDAKARAKSGSALSELENIALRSNIRKNISSMKPQISSAAPEGHRETTIEIRIENITLYELVNYLNMAEGSAHPMRIKKLNIKTRYDNPKNLIPQLLSQAWNTVKNRSKLTRILLYLLYFVILFFCFSIFSSHTTS